MSKVTSRKSCTINIELNEAEAITLVAILGSVSLPNDNTFGNVLEGLINELEISDTAKLQSIYDQVQGVLSFKRV